MRLHDANGCWTRGEMVVVETERGVVYFVMKAGLDGVAELHEILAVEIGDENLAIAVLEAIQAAVGVLLEHCKIGGVVLIAIRSEIAEQSQPGLLIGEDESAEIAGEGLNAGAYGDEIVLVAEVLQLGFDEPFLQAKVRVETRAAFAHVDVDDAIFLDIDVVEVQFGSEPNAPVDGAERCVAAKQVKGEGQVLAHEVLAKTAKEF